MEKAIQSLIDQYSKEVEKLNKKLYEDLETLIKSSRKKSERIPCASESPLTENLLKEINKDKKEK